MGARRKECLGHREQTVICPADWPTPLGALLISLTSPDLTDAPFGLVEVQLLASSFVWVASVLSLPVASVSDFVPFIAFFAFGYEAVGMGYWQKP